MLVNIVKFNAEKAESLKNKIQQSADEQTYEEADNNNEKSLQVKRPPSLIAKGKMD
jgi:hypothetical protein